MSIFTHLFLYLGVAPSTCGSDVQSYDGKLPVEIYEQYMEKWKDVNLIPKEINLMILTKTLSNSQ